MIVSTYDYFCRQPSRELPLSSQVFKYLKYRFKAVSKHKVHSPFVFDLIENVFENENSYYAFITVELARKKMLASKKTIEIVELGAGSKVFKTNQRRVGEIAKHSTKPEKYGQLLFKLSNYFQPKTIIEIGTSLGLSTAYMAKARLNSKIYSLEGSPEIIQIAKANFKSMHIKNVEVIQGNFDKTLPNLLSSISTVSLVFFDGNHQKEATLNYFKQCLEKANDESVFIFDDINWSDGMTEAWKEIKNHPKVTLTIDIFQFGIVFFKKGVEKQHFVLKY